MMSARSDDESGTSTADATEQDGVASLLDSQADAGDEDADTGIYTLDTREAREAGVDLDVMPDEPPLT